MALTLFSILLVLATRDGGSYAFSDELLCELEVLPGDVWEEDGGGEAGADILEEGVEEGTAGDEPGVQEDWVLGPGPSHQDRGVGARRRGEPVDRAGQV